MKLITGSLYFNTDFLHDFSLQSNMKPFDFILFCLYNEIRLTEIQKII